MIVLTKSDLPVVMEKSQLVGDAATGNTQSKQAVEAFMDLAKEPELKQEIASSAQVAMLTGPTGIIAMIVYWFMTGLHTGQALAQAGDSNLVGAVAPKEA